MVCSLGVLGALGHLSFPVNLAQQTKVRAEKEEQAWPRLEHCGRNLLERGSSPGKGMSEHGTPRELRRAEASGARDTPMMSQDRSAGAQGQRALSKSIRRAETSTERGPSDVRELSQEVRVSHGRAWAMADLPGSVRSDDFQEPLAQMDGRQEQSWYLLEHAWRVPE